MFSTGKGFARNGIDQEGSTILLGSSMIIVGLTPANEIQRLAIAPTANAALISDAGTVDINARDY